MRNFATAPPSDLVIARLAARQHGLVKTRHLLDAGLVRSAIWRRVEAGRLHRKYRGVYAVGHPKLSREGEFLAAVYAAGEGALLSHFAAAELYGVRRYRASVVDVVVPSGRRAEPGIRVHVSRHLERRDRTTHKGIPVTTLARLFVDLTDVVEEPLELANVIHEAAFKGWFNERATREAMARANGRHKLHILHEALKANHEGSAGLKSRNEAAFHSMLKLAQLPRPKVNVHLAGEEVDFHWPARLLAVEIDGPGHARRRTQSEDRAKERVLHAAGYRVLRFSERDLAERPHHVIETVKAAIT